MTVLSSSHPIRRPVRPRNLTLSDMIALYRQRRALARLDDAALRDIGISRAEANEESRRHFWDIPTKSV